MIDPEGIRRKAKGLYSKFLRHKMQQQPFFPCPIPFGKKLPPHFAELNQCLKALEKGSKAHKRHSYSVEYAPRKTRKFGEQSLPLHICFETEADFLGFLQKQQETQDLLECFAHFQTAFPALQSYFLEKPSRLRRYLGITEACIEVLHYFVAHPCPGLYIRELPLSVHSKFIEQQQGPLRALLDQLLPESAIHRASNDFIDRYGLRRDEARVRFRQLDAQKDKALFQFSKDLSLPLSDFLSLPIEAEIVLICENLLSFLSLPTRANSLAIFGQGFAVSQLRNAHWLNDKQIYYWGDLDPHGFYILSVLRSAFPQTQSLLMDAATFQAHAHYAVPNKAKALEPKHLLPEEQELFEYLSREQLRLEQERIQHKLLLEVLEKRVPR